MWSSVFVLLCSLVLHNSLAVLKMWHKVCSCNVPRRWLSLFWRDLVVFRIGTQLITGEDWSWDREKHRTRTNSKKRMDREQTWDNVRGSVRCPFQTVTRAYIHALTLRPTGQANGSYTSNIEDHKSLPDSATCANCAAVGAPVRCHVFLSWQTSVYLYAYTCIQLCAPCSPTTSILL